MAASFEWAVFVGLVVPGLLTAFDLVVAFDSMAAFGLVAAFDLLIAFDSMSAFDSMAGLFGWAVGAGRRTSAELAAGDAW